MRQPEGREVVIVEAVRTPIGRGHKEKGYYKDTHPNELLGTCYTEVINRAGIDAAQVEDVIAGCVMQFGAQAVNVGRNAVLAAYRVGFSSTLDHVMVIAAVVAFVGAVSAFALVRQQDFVAGGAPSPEAAVAHA